MNLFYSIFENAIDVLFPKRCMVCRKASSFLCIPCIATFPRATLTKQAFIISLFDYRHAPTKRAVWRFKYGNIRGIADSFGESLYEEIIVNLSEQLIVSQGRTFLLVPIPLHQKRLRERGYNQSELLVKSIMKHDTQKIFSMSLTSLKRIRETKAQAKKERRSERFQNLHGAFQASSNEVQNRDIILIDDVATTGATLCEARKALLSAGAKSVYAYTVAH